LKTEQEKQKILEIIKKHNDGPSSLIQVLNAIQEEHDYLPKEVQQLVAREMKIPFSKVFEVSSFYSRFTTEKKGKNHVTVCTGTACFVKGAQNVLDEFKSKLNLRENETTDDGLYTVTSSRCIGACALAPVITVNKDTHSKLTVENVPEVLDMYK